jgi:glutathione S-transferase
MLKLYHAEPLANSLKCLIPLKEKGLAFESVYVDLHKFEQHEPWFVAINPDGQVPVLDHDGVIVVARIPLHEQREKWRTARSGFSESDLANATRKVQVAVGKVEQQLARTPWLAGDMYTLADINFFAHCGIAVNRLFPEMEVAKRAPRLMEWVERVKARPGVKEALAMPDKTNPALRTFSGDVR